MTVPAASGVQAPSPKAARDFVREVLGTIRDPDALAVVSVPAPLAPLETLLRKASAEDALVWGPPEGPSFSAVGAAVTFTGTGQDRYAQIERGANGLWSQVTTATLGENAPPPLRCFGGFSFQPGWAEAEPWTTFGDARFVIPRLRYARAGEHAWLSLAVRGHEAMSASRRETFLSLVDDALALLRTAHATRKARPDATRHVIDRRETSEAEWRTLVSEIVGRIGRREFEKVVIARRTMLSFDGSVDVADVLAELALSSERSTRFAFRFGGVTFLGATPERLVRRTGCVIDTEALAGSNRPGDAARAMEMLESPKEREEHELVVQEIVKNLSPVCATLEHPNAPEVRALRHVIHLTTPIRGRLTVPLHVLELVLRLHPTPAVGGVPAPEAVRFIREHEASERGWYASPIGWFDADGDGEFAVGLRSGALVKDRAYLYAGGGIVRDSDPASEYAEIRLKLAVLCAALHVAE